MVREILVQGFTEVVVEEEDDDEDEEGKDDEENDDVCLWHDPFLNQYNLEMEILDECGLEMIQVREGGSRVADEGSTPDLPFAEGVRSIPSQYSKWAIIGCFLFSTSPI